MPPQQPLPPPAPVEAEPSSSAPMAIKVVATISRFIWPKAGSAATSGSDWCIVEIEGDGLPVATAKGKILGAAVGKTFDLEGEVKSDKFGRHLEVKRAVQVVPKTTGAITRYLKTLPGIGTVTAGKLVHVHGTDTLNVLREASLEDIRTSMGDNAGGLRLTEETLKQVRMALDADSTVIELEMRVRSMLGPIGSEAIVRRVLDEWGNEAPARIQRNPWSLAKLPSIGFLKADSVAVHLGIDLQDANRIQAGIRHQVDQLRSSGHTRHLRFTIADETQVLLGFDRHGDGFDLIDQELTKAIEAGDYVVVEDAAGAVELAADYRCEQEIAERLKRRMARERRPIKPFEVGYESLFPDQLAALKAMLKEGSGGTFVLTGAPGTGKSVLTHAILPSFSVLRVKLCAPTGKAARRLQEVSGHVATTIHSLLEPRPHKAAAGDATTDNAKKGGSVTFAFARCETNLLEVDLVVMDEASMVDIYLFRDLLRALPDSAFLLIVGDPNQLPSVGVGSVLRDLLRAGTIPGAELTQIKRQNPGLLLTHIHEVKAGRWTKVVNSPTNDLVVFPAATEDDATAAIIELYMTRLPKMLVAHAAAEEAAGKGKRVPDPLQDIQILLPWRKSRKFNTELINAEIQKRRVAAGLVELAGKWKLGVGDKVVQCRNDYEVGVVNGDIGCIVGMEQHEDSTTGKREWKYICRFAGYDGVPHALPAVGNDLELAYAVTIHKYQGSQAPVVMLPAIGTESGFYDRALFYTGLSRASRMAVLVGAQEGLVKVISRVMPENRRTSLEAMLKA